MFQFAWVQPNETEFGPQHNRFDEDVIGIELNHSEGDFAQLTIEIKNPRRYLLENNANIWVWLAWNEQPLFFGRLVAIPEDLSAEIVKLSLIARPSNFEQQKETLAASLKVAPFWDNIWILEDRINDPDSVLEARPDLWCIDRLTHELTISNIYAGEDGTNIYGGDIIIYDSLRVTYSNPPIRRVKVQAQISWDQTAEGTLDLTKDLIRAFADAGSQRADRQLISSFTGQGLEADWPETGTDIKGGWYIGEQSLIRADGVWVTPRYLDTNVYSIEPVDKPATEQFFKPTTDVRFFIWEFLPTFKLDYISSRQRIEEIEFDLEADIQFVFSDPGEDEVEYLTLSSRRISDPLDEDSTTPIMQNSSRNEYLKTNRGRRSLEYLIMVARARLLSRARAVEITIDVPFQYGLDLTLRKNATIIDSRLPGGEASGKIIGYTLSANNGQERATITIGCMIGLGNTVSARSGTPTYSEGYEEGYQFLLGADYMPVPSEITYEDFTDTLVPKKLNFGNLKANAVVKEFEVINGETAQRAVLNNIFEDTPQAIQALNDAHTEVWLELEPLIGGPFITTYNINLSKLMVPRTITL